MHTSDAMPTDADFDTMGERILRRTEQVDRKRERRRIGIGAVVVAATVLSGTAALVLATTAQQETTAYCYHAADADSRSTQVATPDEVWDAQGRPIESVIGDAIEKCAAVWRIGFFESEQPPVDDGTIYEVPELQLCIRSDQVAAVLPTGSFIGTNEAFCNELGLVAP